MIAGDVGQEAFCKDVVDQTMETFGRLDILVNKSITDIILEARVFHHEYDFGHRLPGKEGF